MDRAELGVDGNCAFALLGPNIQEGEAEFVEIQSRDMRGSGPWCDAARAASGVAYRRLKARLSPREFSYFIGPSHPSFV